MGRNEVTIDWPKVDSLLKAQCDGTGIAAMLGIHPNTLYRKCEEKHGMSFSDYSALKRGEGKELLRAKMFDAAMKGDKTMQIFLAKNYLGMSDRQEVKHEGEIVSEIIWEPWDKADTVYDQTRNSTGQQEAKSE